MRLIDADAFKEKYGDYYAEEGTTEGFIGTVGQLIDNAPTVEERPKGKWVEVDVRNCHATLKCSVCDRVIEPSFNFGEYSYEDIKTFYPYCHCGADMRSTHEE